jgi:hypothetical protein
MGKQPRMPLLLQLPLPPLLILTQQEQQARSTNQCNNVITIHLQGQATMHAPVAATAPLSYSETVTQHKMF